MIKLKVEGKVEVAELNMEIELEDDIAFLKGDCLYLSFNNRGVYVVQTRPDGSQETPRAKAVCMPTTKDC